MPLSKASKLHRSDSTLLCMNCKFMNFNRLDSWRCMAGSWRWRGSTLGCIGCSFGVSRRGCKERKTGSLYLIHNIHLCRKYNYYRPCNSDSRSPSKARKYPPLRQYTKSSHPHRFNNPYCSCIKHSLRHKIDRGLHLSASILGYRLSRFGSSNSCRETAAISRYHWARICYIRGWNCHRIGGRWLSLRRGCSCRSSSRWSFSRIGKQIRWGRIARSFKCSTRLAVSIAGWDRKLIEL